MIVNTIFNRLSMRKGVVFLTFTVLLIGSGCDEEKSKAEQVRDALHTITKIPEKAKKMDSTINETAKQAIMIANEIEEEAPSKVKHAKDPAD